MTVKTWVADELKLVSTKSYNDPFEDVDISASFTLGDKKITFSGFWDGGSIWRVRFSLPEAGLWSYEITCTDESNTSLTACGEVECVPYDGDLEIYKRGFIKTVPDVRYFMYADGTPFFYLGDTHWNFLQEEFDEAGEHADGLECESHFKYIVDKRVEQGFNVYQSEPIGAKYSLSNGFNESDLESFRELDRRFKYIADAGLVHANAQLLFPGNMACLKRLQDVEYMERLGRYWAARYSAYPCIWTLGQESDDEFYFNRGKQFTIRKENNPFKYVASGLHRADGHKHPLTAHMEYFYFPTTPEDEGTSVSTSAFRNQEGHTFYGYQWNRELDKPLDFSFGKDGMLNGQGKVCILYESRYENLWTKNYGARSQGWIAYLNGLYGYGYGAVDIWLYKSTYDIDKESNDGRDTVSLEDKNVHWPVSVEFETAYQLKYMKDFFQNLEWWKLVPRFDNPGFYVSDCGDFYSLASDERRTIVIYFFNESHESGRLTNLDMCEYTYQWFNPRTGEYSEKRTFWPDTFRSYHIENKPEKLDYVLLIEKVK